MFLFLSSLYFKMSLKSYNYLFILISRNYYYSFKPSLSSANDKLDSFFTRFASEGNGPSPLLSPLLFFSMSWDYFLASAKM